jgi:hypothetical protein
MRGKLNEFLAWHSILPPEVLRGSWQRHHGHRPTATPALSLCFAPVNFFPVRPRPHHTCISRTHYTHTDTYRRRHTHSRFLSPSLSQDFETPEIRHDHPWSSPSLAATDFEADPPNVARLTDHIVESAQKNHHRPSDPPLSRLGRSLPTRSAATRFHIFEREGKVKK